MRVRYDRLLRMLTASDDRMTADITWHGIADPFGIR